MDKPCKYYKEARFLVQHALDIAEVKLIPSVLWQERAERFLATPEQCGRPKDACEQADAAGLAG